MLELEKATESQLNLIYEEFNTTPEAIRRDVRSLMEWMEKQPHLPNIEDEEILTHCLVRCKNRMERCKMVLEAYYTIRATMPEIYDDRDPYDPTIEHCLKAGAFLPLPKLTSDGCRVCILHIFDADLFSKMKPDDMMKVTFMSADLVLKIDNSRMDIIIYNFQDFSIPLIAVILPNMKKYLTLATKGVPMRQKKVYLMNAPAAVEPVIAVGKAFVRQELLRKLEAVRNTEELHKLVPKEILPKDYGGEEASLSELRDGWLDTLKQHRDWFISENNVKADLSKRYAHTNSRLGDTPLEGSFRKITVD